MFLTNQIAQLRVLDFTSTIPHVPFPIADTTLACVHVLTIIRCDCIHVFILQGPHISLIKVTMWNQKAQAMLLWSMCSR